MSRRRGRALGPALLVALVVAALVTVFLDDAPLGKEIRITEACELIQRGRVESTVVGDAPADVLKHLHLVFSNLKTWLDGTHHGRVSKKHLQRYLDEFTFRFNRRHSPQAAFQTILGIVARTPPRTYEQVYGDEPVDPLPF